MKRIVAASALGHASYYAPKKCLDKSLFRALERKGEHFHVFLYEYTITPCDLEDKVIVDALLDIGITLEYPIDVAYETGNIIYLDEYRTHSEIQECVFDVEDVAMDASVPEGTEVTARDDLRVEYIVLYDDKSSVPLTPTYRINLVEERGA